MFLNKPETTKSAKMCKTDNRNRRTQLSKVSTLQQLSTKKSFTIPDKRTQQLVKRKEKEREKGGYQGNVQEKLEKIASV